MSHDPNRPFDDAQNWEDDDPFADDEDAGEDDFDDEEPFDLEGGDPFESALGEDELPFAALDGDPFDDDPFEVPTEIAPHLGARCAGCGTTWDRIRADGRAGCAGCYATFRVQLSGVMGRVQRGETHVGKTPRAIEARRLRLEQLRQRRDNQLLLLQNRLQNAVAAEKYEEAAKLRDKIKIVSATIVE